MAMFIIALILIIGGVSLLGYWMATAPRWDLYTQHFGKPMTVAEFDTIVPQITASVDRNFTRHSALNFEEARQVIAGFDGVSREFYSGCDIDTWAWVWRGSGMKPVEWEKARSWTDWFRTKDYSKVASDSAWVAQIK